MEILDKYKDIITRIEEMCTSTVAMAPYPVPGVSITRYQYGVNKSKGGRKEKTLAIRKAIVEELIKQQNGSQNDQVMYKHKFKKRNQHRIQRSDKDMDITETMNAIATLCEAIIDEAALTTPEIRARVERQQEIATSLRIK